MFNSLPTSRVLIRQAVGEQGLQGVGQVNETNMQAHIHTIEGCILQNMIADTSMPLQTTLPCFAWHVVHVQQRLRI